MSDNPLAALAMRDRAAKSCDVFCNECARSIRALPTTFTDAELLAAAMQLPEVRALVEAAIDMRDYGTVLAEQKYHHNLAAALVPFMKGGDK